MSETPITPRHAWQPLTPRGVAAFAADSLGRLWLVQLIVAVLAAAMVVCFVSANWVPVARAAAEALPASAEIRGGRLLWTNDTPVCLAQSRLLALRVDAKDSGAVGREAEVEIILHGTNFIVASLFGFVVCPYPREVMVDLGRTSAIPWWGAWEDPILGLLAGAVVLLLMASWFVLATLYCPFVKVFAFYANRRLGWRGSWKLAGAAHLPGAFLVMAGIFCYGWLSMDLLRVGLIYLLHFVTTWIYLAVSPFFLPKDPQAVALPPNPFVPPAPEKPDPEPSPEQAPIPPVAPAKPLVVSTNPFTSPPDAQPKARPDPENPFAAPR